MPHPNEIAFQVGKAILEAAQTIGVTVESKAATITVVGTRAWNRPRLPHDRPLPGLESLADGAWPAWRELRATWNGTSSVLLGLRLTVWRQPGAYEGHLAMQIVTLPSNRELVWINLTKRIEDALATQSPRVSIPANFGLWARTGERSARPLTDALTRAAEKAGFVQLSAKEFQMFDILLPSGETSPPPREVFERLAKTALLKLPYVTRGEPGDVEGSPIFDISVLQRQAAEVKDTSAIIDIAPPPEAPVASSQTNVLFNFIALLEFGPFEEFAWEKLGKINVIVGENDTGKSHLLKAMYTVARSVEEFTLRSHPDSDKPPWPKVLEDKLVWTFEPLDRKLNRLMRRASNTPNALVDCAISNEYYTVFLHREPKDDKPISARDDAKQHPDLHALFIPPKEVLTSLQAIESVRDRLKIFGFDDTYVDLVRALRGDPVQQVLPDEFQRVLDELDKVLKGRIRVDQGRFFFDRQGESFSMSQTAEGIKKIGILSRLIQNGELRRNTVLFLDEPEVNLHPRAARALVRMLFDLSNAGVQIFAATHSYYVLKQFEILARAQARAGEVMLCSLSRDEVTGYIDADFSDLREGLPETAIRREALDQYDEDIAVSMKKQGA